MSDNVSEQKKMFKMIAALTGQSAVLTISKAYIDILDGDLYAALLLGQCIYWSDKGQKLEFYKSNAEWRDELGMNDYRIRKARKALCDIGFISTRLKRANNAPTTHYTVHHKAIIDAISRFVEGDKIGFVEGGQNDLLTVAKSDLSKVNKTDLTTVNKSITETTTENTQKNTTQEKDTAPNGADAKAEKPTTPPDAAKPKTKRKAAKPKPTKPPKPEYWGDLLVETAEVYSMNTRQACKLAEQLAGVAPTGERAEYNCTPPAQLGDVKEFTRWYRQQTSNGASLPEAADTLDKWWYRWQEQRKKIDKTLDTFNADDFEAPSLEPTAPEYSKVTT